MLKHTGVVGLFAVLTALLVPALGGCGGGGSTTHSGGDSGSGADTSVAASDSGSADVTTPQDSGMPDSTAPDDTAVPEDSSTSPPEDSSTDDSGTVDSAPADAPEDTSVVADSASADTGTVGDSGAADAADATPFDALDGGVVDVTVSYTVGGTVAGLVTGESVVLQDNLGNDLTVSANGSFTFTNPLMTGHAYAVTVLTQPSSPVENCVVTAGSGMIAAVNVTTVSVMCAETSFTVGGTIMGLGTGATVVLQDNSGNNLAVNANGAFSFTTPVASGAGYAVSVFTQPTNPVQTCVVTAGSGTVASSNVTSVVVNCASNSFTVGGAVSGLAFGDSIALQDNGGDTVFVTQNGGFAFPTSVASGAMYAVTIQANPLTPTPQMCVVTNGSGTVGNANVTTAQVTCTTTYTVSGIVTGLPVGVSVGLTNNGTQTLTPTGNGSGDQSFVFPTPQVNGSAYAVTVPTPPTGQTCYVANARGTIQAANVTNVIVRCRTGLVAYYPFDEGSGTVMTDVVGTNNGTHNAAYITGVSGTALSFNGVNQYGEVIGNATYTWGAANAPYTVDYWVFTNEIQSNWVTLFHKSDMTGGNISNVYERSPGEWFCPGNLEIHTPMSSTAGVNDLAICSSWQLTVGTWYHFATVHDPTIGTNGSEVVYVNGVVMSTLALGGTTVGGQGIVWIAASNPPGDDGYDVLNGSMDELRIYNVALTQAQVMLDMQ